MVTSEVIRESRVEFRAGQLVEVRSAAEILATLDENGELEALPFQPEMLQHCGKRFAVHAVAHKTCDTINRTGMRRMENAVHLRGVRCDGSAHGGCQAACLMFWKNAWLRPVDDANAPLPDANPDATTRVYLQIQPFTHREPDEDGTERFRCQVTELLRAAPTPLPLRELDQYRADVRSGNATLKPVAKAFSVGVFNRFQSIARRKLPKPLRFKHGLPWGFLAGALDKTPTGTLDLQLGEWVRIKSREEIQATLNPRLENRGLGFDAEMVRFCGRVFKVTARVDHILDEKTGRMLYMKSPCIVLENVVCEGAFNANCPRAITAYWREIWLDRVEAPE